jgi:hypothetical protein
MIPQTLLSVFMARSIKIWNSGDIRVLTADLEIRNRPQRLRHRRGFEEAVVTLGEVESEFN